jgi:hypothetical protein
MHACALFTACRSDDATGSAYCCCTPGGIATVRAAAERTYMFGNNARPYHDIHLSQQCKATQANVIWPETAPSPHLLSHQKQPMNIVN